MAVLNKASEGELRFPLPVGFVFEDDKIVLDPDQEVQGAVRTVFDLFALESTAFGVVQRFNEFDLRFRRRPYGGAWDGILFWGRLTHSRVLGILANPSYATPMCSGDTNRPITDCRFVLLPLRCNSGIPRRGDGVIRAICQD
jgi:hypothetical protein